MKAVRINQFGGPDVLSLEEVAPVEPGKGNAAVKIQAVGVNYIDIYHRTVYTKSQSPSVQAWRAAGVVESVGPGVTDLKPGDRVGYAMALGSDHKRAIVSSRQLVKLPEEVSFERPARVFGKT